ncbi:hypothetical protein CD29_00380 [Ureibacillus manganicus DSM 26584]|uniref:Uncharacterized protein n=1 Tax=Ureibacillus manganicus DSM 26584 TaxID=1384049 RepID=A0A0A3IA93_9BACL|nr:hypothetical protein CD29_00380 [Ureibacillus manganicus DSM 26584]
MWLLVQASWRTEKCETRKSCPRPPFSKKQNHNNQKNSPGSPFMILQPIVQGNYLDRLLGKKL